MNRQALNCCIGLVKIGFYTLLGLSAAIGAFTAPLILLILA
jgi:hypothetical protein